MSKREFFPAINLLRIISCLIIVCFHYYPLCGGGFFRESYLVNTIVSNGTIMVNLFFVISGFCMAANYKETIMNGLGFREFFIRHYLKFLMYSLLTTPVGVISCLLGSKANMPSISISFSEIIRELLCIKYGWVYTVSMPYNGPIWFINILLIMYLAYYACCKCKKAYLSACTFFMLLGLFMHYYVNSINLPLINDSSHIGYYNFFFGTLLYEVYRLCAGNKKRILMWGGIFGFGTVLLIVFWLALGMNDWIGNAHVSLLFTMWPFLIWLMVFFKPVNRLADKKSIKQITKLATSIYIWHNPLMYILFYLAVIFQLNVNFNSFGTFVPILGYVFVVALISNRFVEPRFEKLLHFLFGLTDKTGANQGQNDLARQTTN